MVGRAAMRWGVWAIAAMLSGCALFGQKATPPPCPEIGILAEANQLTRFRPGPGRDLIDILFEVEMADVGGTCQHALDTETGEGTLTVEMAVVLKAARGAADKSRQAVIPYFVAITDSQRKPITKSVFQTRIPFPGNTSRLTVTDNNPGVTLDIPLLRGQTGRNFKIYAGLQLTKEELEYNRWKNTALRRSRPPGSLVPGSAGEGGARP